MKCNKFSNEGDAGIKESLTYYTESDNIVYYQYDRFRPNTGSDLPSPPPPPPPKKKNSEAYRMYVCDFTLTQVDEAD